MRYLVTGGCGSIGGTFALKMLAAGHEVEIIDPCDEPRNKWITDRLVDAGASRSDIFETGVEKMWSSMPAILERADYVLHAGAFTGIPHSVLHPDADWQSNVEATRALLEGLRRVPRPTVVLSSVKPYRVNPFPPGGLDESAMLEPDEPYASSKATQTMLCMAYARSYNVPVVTFRCSNLFSNLPCHGPRHAWLTWFCISAAIGRPIEVQGSGLQCRDMLFGTDVASAVLDVFSAYDSFQFEKLRGQVFNLGGGLSNVISVGEAANLLHELTGVPVVSGPARAMDDDRVWVNTSKFRVATGWEPAVGVEEGMRTILSWAQSHKSDLIKMYEGT